MNMYEDIKLGENIRKLRPFNFTKDKDNKEDEEC